MNIGDFVKTRKRSAKTDADRPGLMQTIFEGLRDEITGGKIKPGACVSRRAVAARYGSSYIPVIEAMARLESVGLIETEARQVARVRRITTDTIHSDYVIREAFETQAIRLACEAATPAEIEELYTLAEQVDALAPAPARGTAADEAGLHLHWRFHRRITELSRCRALVLEMERIELLRRLQANWFYHPEIKDPPRYHSLLVDAIQARDPAAADAVMRAHVRVGLEKELLGYRMRIDL
jgi:DNA-binding GntR family transcriptional regulator